MTRLHVSPIAGDGALIYRSGNALAYLVGVPVSSLDKVAGRLANAEPVAWMAVLQAFQVTGAAVIDESNDRTRLRYTGMVEIQVLNGSPHPNEPDGSLFVGTEDVRIMHLSVDDRLRINPRPDAMGIGNLEGGSMAVDSLFIRVGELEETATPDSDSTDGPVPGQVRASIPLPPISTAGAVVPPGDEVFEPDPTVFHVPLHNSANEAQVIDITAQTTPSTVDVSPPDIAATSNSTPVASPPTAPSTAFVVEPPDAKTPSAPELVIVEQQTDETTAPSETKPTDADDADSGSAEQPSAEPDTNADAADTNADAADTNADAADTNADAADTNADVTADAADDKGDADEAGDGESNASETTATDEVSTSAENDDDSASDELDPDVAAIEPEVAVIEAAQITVVEAEPIEAKVDASEPDAEDSDSDTESGPSQQDDSDVTARADESTGGDVESTESNDESAESADEGTEPDDASNLDDSGHAEADGSADADTTEDASEGQDPSEGQDTAQHEVDAGDDASGESDEPESSTASTQGELDADDAEEVKTGGDEDNVAETSSEPGPTVFLGAPAKTEKSGFDAPYQPSFKKVPLITKSNEAVVVADEAANADATALHDTSEPTEESPSDPSPSDQTCVNGHRNKPTAALCSTCGERLNAPAEGGRVFMRPGVVGTLTFDDGEQFDISNDLLVGRAPGIPVIGDTAEFPGDPMMSREHFRIEVDDHSVVVRDLNSSNGTMVRFASDGGYERLLPGEAYPLSNGAVIVAGQRWATFALHVE